MSSAAAVQHSHFEQLWLDAQDAWGGTVRLRPPEPIDDPKSQAIAYISLDTRTTRVNFALLERRGLGAHIGTIMAHEVGHHLRYPHTLFDQRRQQLFLRTELMRLMSAAQRHEGARNAADGRFDFVLNVFQDWLINTDLVTMSEDASRLDSFVALYRELVTSDCKDTFASFYMALYEASWGLPAQTLVSERMHELCLEVNQHYTVIAQRLVRFMQAHEGEPYLQLAAFLVEAFPFLRTPDKDESACKQGGLEGDPSMGGELSDSEISRLLEESSEVRDAKDWLEQRTSSPSAGEVKAPKTQRGQPGFPARNTNEALDKLVPPGRVALAWYRKNARKAVMRMPASEKEGEPFVPGPSATWELDDELSKLDWVASLTASGVLVPGQTTLLRTYFPDDPQRGQERAPWIEMYVDSSGSMPNPTNDMNPQVLAGFALMFAAIEAQGRVRVVQYSGSMKCMPDFVASATPIERALLEYIGGGTEFPFGELLRSATLYRRRARVVRVVFSDSDFYYNVTGPQKGVDPWPAMREACSGGDQLVVVLVATSHEVISKLKQIGVDVVLLADRSQLLAAAQKLAEEIFKKDARA